MAERPSEPEFVLLKVLEELVFIKQMCLFHILVLLSLECQGMQRAEH